MKIRHTLAVLLIVAATAVGMGLTPQPAQAGVTLAQAVDYHAVCRRQGAFAASTWNPLSPYAWYCYTISFPVGITYAGGLDIQGWCSAYMKGSRAEVWENNAWGWRCVLRL